MTRLRQAGVIPLSLTRIAEITGATLDRIADPAAVVHGPVVVDSRLAVPGSLFVAVPGTRVDGHDFAATAMAAGAIATLATRPVGTPALLVSDVLDALARLARDLVVSHPDLTVAGITGSSGKTTTKDLLAQLAERLGPTVAPVGSFNNEIGHPLTVLRADERTRYLVLELAAHRVGDIAELCAIAPPRFGAVLNVGRSHVATFGDLDGVARAKGELVEALPADGVAVLNADDRYVAAMASRTAARVRTFGTSQGADVRGVDIAVDGGGRPSFTLVTDEGKAPVQLRLHGAHNVANALAAAAVAVELGMSLGAVADGLSAATARSRWRMEVIERPDGVTLINDAYNANPESVRRALETLAVMVANAWEPGERGRRDEPGSRDERRRSGGRAFAVLGHMAELGRDSVADHGEIGALAARLGVHGLVVVGDQAAPIAAGARSERSWRGELLQVPDGQAAVKAVGARLRPGDVVLVKASRSVGLERIVPALLGEGGA